MTPEPPTPTPRRKRRYFLWLGVLLLVFFAYRGWKEYDYRAAVKEAKALGWRFTENSFFDDIKKDWHAAMRKETWTKVRRGLVISHTNGFSGDESLILRLNPQSIIINNYPSSWNLSLLKSLPDLHNLWISGSPELTNDNMDQIQELGELRNLYLTDCRSLTRLNSFIGLKKLEKIGFWGVPLIPLKDIEAFKAAHPNTKVNSN